MQAESTCVLSKTSPLKIWTLSLKQASVGRNTAHMLLRFDAGKGSVQPLPAEEHRKPACESFQAPPDVCFSH